MNNCKTLATLMEGAFAQAVMSEARGFPSGAKKRKRERWPADASKPGEVWRKLGDFRMWLESAQLEFPKSTPAGKLVWEFRKIFYFIAFPVPTHNPEP